MFSSEDKHDFQNNQNSFNMKLNINENLKKNDLYCKQCYGFYFIDKVTIDDISAERIMPYVMLKYADDNNISNVKYDLQCVIDSDNMQVQSGCDKTNQTSFKERG